MSQIELQPGFDFQKAGKDVLEIEREGLAQLDQYINQDFSLACEKIFYCAGKVVVMGMGKSGHIGRKMAATFASTGTSSFFVHPGKPRTGTGMVTPQDIVIALSNSGESNEIGAHPGSEATAGAADLHDQPSGKQHGACSRYSPVREGSQGGLSARSGADLQHHRCTGHGRCACRGAA